MQSTTWNLNHLLKDEKEISKLRIETDKKHQDFIQKWSEKKSYLDDPKKLKEALVEYEELNRLHPAFGNEAWFYSLLLCLDQNNAEIKAKLYQAEDFSRKLKNSILFFENNLTRLQTETQKKFLASSELKNYRHFLEKLFLIGKYTLPINEEKILTLKQSVAYENWIEMTENFLSQETAEITEEGKKKTRTFSELSSLLSHPDKKTRDEVAKKFNQILEKHKNLAEIELNSVLANKKIDDELRGAVEPDDIRLASDFIDKEIVNSMIQSVTKYFNISKDYYKLKSKIFGYKKLEYHERNIKYGKDEIPLTWEEALSLIRKVFKELDPEFEKILDYFINNGLIDVYPAQGKRGGAFCSANSIENPIYIMLNFTGKLRDVTTLAHELGHGINDYLMQQNVNSLDFSNTLAVAEVSSTFMEDFVLDEFLKECDKEIRLKILMEKMDDDVSSVFRQITCYNFERDLHHKFRQKGYLSAKEIGKLFKHHMNSYMGDYVDQPENSENWWIYWSHIRIMFYNYSYANGLLISKYLQKNVRHNHTYIKKVKEFMSKGESESPEKIFKNIDIDITKENFWEESLEEIKDNLTKIENLAKELGHEIDV